MSDLKKDADLFLLQMTRQAKMKVRDKPVDNETAHIMEDELKNKFIEQLAHDSIHTAKIKPIAQVLDKISKLTYDRWYA